MRKGGWTLHLMSARGQLDGVERLLSDAAHEAQERLGQCGALASADIVIRASDRAMPPELGVCGASYGPGRIDVVVDLHRPHDPVSLHQKTLKTLFHEAHHLLRWDGPGYGETLGGALVSEGLAQCFVHEMMECPPEPWEGAVSPADCNLWRKAARAQYGDAGYSHSDWFFGTADMPDALGYSLGALMVRRHLAQAPGRSALSLAIAPAEQFATTLDQDF